MTAKILWADDEIEHLKAHLMFLENKGYSITTVTSGVDALEEIEKETFDIVFLDENMPGISGLETLEKIKRHHPEIPVVMITKSEEEFIMEDAIGGKISDYLIKPVNPNQILLTLRKNLDGKELESKRIFNSYMQKFREMTMELSNCRELEDFTNIYERLVFWELELEQVKDKGLHDILQSQKMEVNREFGKFIQRNYTDWFNGDTPLMSHTLFREKMMPVIKNSNEKVLLLMIDNLRFDQWKLVKSMISNIYKSTEEGMYCSILPTATQYARNAFFAGLMPADIAKTYPSLWIDENQEGSKNAYEKELFEHQLNRLGWKGEWSYHKITGLDYAKKLLDNFNHLSQKDLQVIVYNFVDMLSHARTDMEVIKELAEDEAAYRSITKSWFEHSPLFEYLKKCSEKRIKVIITTDHGTVRVQNPSQVMGDKQTSTNLRYKTGKRIGYNEKDVMTVSNPAEIHLPSQNISSSFIFAMDDTYLVYKNNYNKYVKMYRNTFQHGGISMEEMLIPYAILDPK